MYLSNTKDLFFNFRLLFLLVCLYFYGLCLVWPPVAFSGENEEEFFDLFKQYVQIDTSNPPGNEVLAARFFADIFDREGIDYELVESAPGRANVRAVIKGRDPAALVLLHHMDVVPANPEQWEYPPFSGQVDDHFIHGRGTVDTKSLGIFHLYAFLALHRSGKEPARDVVFMASADEEAGSYYGIGWLQMHRPEWFKNINVVLNEGAAGKMFSHKKTYAIEVTQKIPLWLRLEAFGDPGHGASPHSRTSVTRLLEAGVKVSQLQFKPYSIAPVTDYLNALAPLYDPPWRERFANVEEMLQSVDMMAELHQFDPRMYALLTSSCTPTRIEGSNKINVVPATAFLELDCRLLPNTQVQPLIKQIKTLVGSDVSVKTLLTFKPGISSNQHPLFKTIADVLGNEAPGTIVLPKVSPGFTDSHFFREMGIPAFGFSPIMLSEEGSYGAHGMNEKLSLEDFYQGLKTIKAIVFDYLEE